ncbi:metabotropic glutamate receptor-like [Amphiura filiformis]|uniref:metabotropic glutamate receptor-like n=1 Tax=Amphiura filiformis TaxID=82378 RepID=UPI003B21A984
MMYNFFVLLWIILLWLTTRTEPSFLARRQQCVMREKHGSFRLAGLFSIHTDQMFPCVNNVSTTGVFQAEAMVFAIESINKRFDLLPGITLGYEIWDDGWSESMVMATTLSLLNGLECFEENQFGKDAELIGIVGTSRSATTILITRLARIFETPVISYYATSDELSNKAQFPYFMRTVPPDVYQVQAIVDVIAYFEWDYIAVIHSIDSYGIQGAQQIYAKTVTHGICVAFFVPISVSPNINELDDLVDKIQQHEKIKVIVIFAATQVAYTVFKHAMLTDMRNDITWLAGDGISSDLIDHDFRAVTKGGLFMDFYSKKVTGFEDYIRNQIADSGSLSPWLSKYCRCQSVYGNCSSFHPSIQQCLSSLPDGFSSSHVIGPVIDAVSTFAIALDLYLRSQCLSSDSVCVTNDFDANVLLEYLHNVSYVGESGEVSFNTNGDPQGKYVMKNLQVVNGRYEFVEVGIWSSQNSSKRWEIKTDQIQFADGSNIVPNATCKTECEVGSYPAPLEMKCCWKCESCLYNEIIVNSTICLPCELTYWPNDNRTSCVSINPTHLNWGSPLLISIITLDFAAIIICAMTVAGIWIYRGHSIIKATSRELSAVNLSGVLLALLTPFPYLSVPGLLSCTAGEICLMIAFCLIFTPTTLKVNRIYRIFRAGQKSARGAGFTSPKYQMILVAVIVTPQILVAIIYAIIWPTRTAYIYFHNQNKLEQYCQMDHFFIIGGTYNSLIILSCCYYAFKARKVPDNYNESRFIALSVYSTVVVCLAAVPVFATATTVLQKVATISFVLLVNAYITLICLYLPKIYAIYFDKGETETNNGMNMLQNRNRFQFNVSSKARVGPDSHGDVTEGNVDLH